jgi:DNA-binding transcriptional MerR regulator
MKSGEVGKMLGIDRSTVKNWTDRQEFSPFFTEGAIQGSELQRDYDHADVLILNTIRAERAKGSKWTDIAHRLATGYRDSELPLSASTVEITPAESFAKALQLQMERDQALEAVAELRDQLEAKEQEIERLRQTKDQELNQVRQEKDSEKERLMREIAELREMIGGLKKEIEITEKRARADGQ